MKLMKNNQSISNTSIKAQKGDFLIESLISMLLMSIICVGTAKISAKSAHEMAQITEGALVVSQLKNILLQTNPNDICSNSYTVYVPTLQENKTIVTSDCSESEVKLTQYKQGSTNAIYIDLTGTELESYQKNIAIGANGYSVNGYAQL